MRVRTKICGITRYEDAAVAVAAGADALGFVFHPASPRFIDPERARAIVDRLPPFVTTVGVFVDVPVAEVRRTADVAGLTLLQFHGDESGNECEDAGRAYVKALRVAGPVDADALTAAHPRARAFLLDAHVPGVPGGTGVTFDWSWWPARSERPLILAGGLAPENVATAIVRTRPYAVDVSGGIESGRRGIKDADKILRFLSEVARAGERL